MKENKECSIIRDLIPNYVEDLVSADTKEFIENHIKTCSECKQIVEEIKSEKIKVNYSSNIEQSKELKYLKRYKRRKLLFKVILFVIIGIIVIIGAFLLIKYKYTTSIITNSYQKGQELKELNNYRLNIVEHTINYNIDQENFYNFDYYYKDGKYKIVHNAEGINQEILNANTTYYGIVDSNKQIQIYDDSKEIKNIETNYKLISKETYINKMYSYFEFYIKDYGFILNFVVNNGWSIKDDRFNGQECYVLRRDDKTSYHEIWISKEEQIPVREVDEIYGVQYIEKTYSLYKNTVKDADLEVSQKVGYTINNIEEK